MKKNTKNPVLEAKNIEENFSEYIESTFEIRDPVYNQLFEEELKKMKDSLYKGPFLCSSLPFQPSLSLNEYVHKEGFHMHEKFLELGGIDKIKDRKLYWHQAQAIKKIEGEGIQNQKRNVVITTGTGSGKTECFMYPILDSLIKEIESNEEGHDKAGIRAIFLFPMNALINDQIDRVREFLSGYTKIKFGFFTGETPEKDLDEASNKFMAMYGKPLSDNELLTREQMRNNPPHILFTNYSMLEYLLLRPQDSALISKDALKYWKYVVLDEAHTYRGALGIEISLLLRRLTGIAQRVPQFILTSATLGKGRQDTDKIIQFAEALTSVEYTPDDIIFAKRIELNQFETSYSIEENDYNLLLENADNKEAIIPIFEKYLAYDDSKKIEVNLFELLSKDRITHELYSLTHLEMDFFETQANLGLFFAKSLVSLVELVSMAVSPQGNKLFDVKYHMFLKAPDGAFITLGKNKQLSLLTCRTIGDYKAFKIGICQNCKTPYVMGRQEDGFLVIDDEVDIDEEYMDKVKQLGYYLIADCLTQAEIDDIEQNHKDEFAKYYVCPRCGSIREFGPKSKKCNCKDNEVILYKYSEHDDPNDEVYSNNIKKCPICDYQTKNGGVVLGFHIGKDRATALIAQILYRAMDYPQVVDKGAPVGMFKKEVTYKNGVKQFIAFSDARQQAAFFNKFLDATDHRFLKKALIWDLLKNPSNNHQPISYPDLVVKLTSKFQANPINYNPSDAIKHASAAALYELLNVDGRNSAEGLGLFVFALNLPDVYNDAQTIEGYLKDNGFDMSAETFRTLTKICLNIFRTTPAIIYPQLTTDRNELDDLLGYRKFINYVRLQLPQGSDDSNVHSFLPKTATSDNKVVKYIKKVLKCDSITAKNFLTILYNAALSSTLVKTNSDNNNQIEANSYSVHSYLEPGLKFYYCDKCKKVTIYNVNDECPEGDCDGHLHECNPDEFFANNYYRKEYMTRPLERVITKEHTAQIKSSEAKKIQNDFREKRINIISCSTTFEMGIDLGGLTTVFMRNIPPTPANYVQRAGRAGRRADTSAFILTFCGTSSHDYTFFDNPEPMIEGRVDPPYFAIENEKIIVRHITASALSFYFKSNPDSFLNVDTFLSNNHIQKFFDYISSKPNDLGEYIDKYVLKTQNLVDVYGNFQWISFIESSSKGALTNMEEGIKDLIATYEYAIKKLFEEKPPRYGADIDTYQDAINKLKYKNSIITYFARYNVIPGYGFPIDNVSLKIYNYQKGDFEDRYDLSRDLSIAVSEYAPESEVIVDGRKYTSRYVFTPYPGAPQSKSYYVRCPHCEAINVYPTKTEISGDTTCKYCNNAFKNASKPYQVSEFIRPTKGFVAGENKETHQIKPARTYASDVVYIGEGKNSAIQPINVSDVITISEFKNEELLILNENPFFYCPTCGFTVVDKKQEGEMKMSKGHKTHKGTPCSGDNKLYRTHFGHTYKTDVVKLEFTGIPKMMDYDCAISTLYAILEGISYQFNIERNDIGGMVFNTAPGLKPWQIILYDTVSGGAGHVKRLESKENIILVLYAAYKKVNPKVPCCDEDTSCYSCLRNFSNQRVHKHLKRGLAKETLEEIIKAVESKSMEMKIDDISLDLSNTDLSEFLTNGYLNSDDIPYFQDLLIRMNAEVVFKPTGYGIVIKAGDGNTYYADFFWKEKGILLFTPDNADSYHKLNNHQSKFDCYMLDEAFNAIDFVNKIRK